MAQAIAYESKGWQRVMTLPVATSETFKKGHILVWSATGLKRHATAGNRAAAVGATAMIAGRAEEDAQRADGSNKAAVSIMIAEPGTWFALPLYHTTPGSAVPTPATQLGMTVGAGFELINASAVTTTGWTAWPDCDAICLSSTTNVKGQIMDFFTEDFATWPPAITSTTTAGITAGTTQAAKVWFEFFSGVCAFSAARAGA